MSDYVNHRDEDGRTTLHHAARTGDLKQCRELVVRGADLEIRDNGGWTAVRRAASWGHLQTVKYLAEAGADIGAKDNRGGDCSNVDSLYGAPRDRKVAY